MGTKEKKASERVVQKAAWVFYTEDWSVHPKPRNHAIYQFVAAMAPGAGQRYRGAGRDEGPRRSHGLQTLQVCSQGTRKPRLKNKNKTEIDQPSERKTKPPRISGN